MPATRNRGYQRYSILSFFSNGISLEAAATSHMLQMRSRSAVRRAHSGLSAGGAGDGSFGACDACSNDGGATVLGKAIAGEGMDEEDHADEVGEIVDGIC